MCELFGFSGREIRDFNPEMQILFSHSEENPNGWGLYMKNGESSFFTKGGEPAHESKELRELLQKPMEATLMMAHIRHASYGANAYLNSHPFQKKDNQGRTWTFMHNGSIFDGPAFDKIEKYREIQDGQTDSERIFLYILDRINQESEKKKAPLSDEEQFHIIEEIIKELSPGNNKVNLMITNGDWFAAHANMAGTLYEKDIPEGHMFATVPFDDIGWNEIELLRLFAYRNGDRIYEGKPHSFIYIEDEERTQALLDALEEQNKRDAYHQ